MNINDKFKEVKPQDTIHKIRTILHDIGISTIDHFVDSKLDDCYSVRVSIANSMFGTNGKGVRKDFALASGYAEFMERLQSNFLYSGRYDQITDKMYGFYYVPDESYATIDDLLNGNNPFVDYFSKRLADEINQNEKAFNFSKDDTAPIDETINKRKAISLWKIFEPKDFNKSDFITIPYYDVKNDKLVNIPNNLLLIYGANGLCAGNTPHEAMVQGLSELFERYTYAQIINNRITPPDIPDDYLANFPEILNYKKLIEASGCYRLIFKDFSLGRNFPVAAVILIDYQNQTYKVSVGSHPAIEIALERSVTEMFQGVSLKKAALLNNFNYDSNMGIGEINFRNLVKCAYGKHPIELFLDKSSYEFKPFKSVSGKNNKTLLDNLLKILFAEGFDLFVRDYSYLGFPVFHLVSYGFSEIYKADLLSIKERNSRKKAEIILNNLHQAKNDELAFLSIVIQFKISSVFENTIPYLFRRPLHDEFIGGADALFFLDFLINYKLKKFEKAVDIIDQIIRRTLPRKSGSREYQYYKCIKDYISAKVEKLNGRDSKDILTKFYDSEIVGKVIREFENADDVLNHFYKKTSCFDCPACEFEASCTYEIIKKIKQKTKKKLKEKMLDQLENKRIFSS